MQAGREEQLDAMSATVLKDAEACDLVTDAAHLEGFEIIEMPFLNERDICDDQIAFVNLPIYWCGPPSPPKRGA